MGYLQVSLAFLRSIVYRDNSVSYFTHYDFLEVMLLCQEEIVAVHMKENGLP
jgi:hypothetical protein